jgi:hypothetical protein
MVKEQIETEVVGRLNTDQRSEHRGATLRRKVDSHVQ